MPLWIVVCYILVSALCIFATVKLFTTGVRAYGNASLVVYVVYTIIFFIVWFFKIAVPPYLLLLTMLVILGACFFGHYLGGYTKSRTFDRYLHGFGSFSFALFTYCVLDNFMDIGGSLWFRALFIFMTGNTLGVFFELIEMLHDVKKKEDPKSQKGLRDTDMDMIANLCGSTLAALFAYLWMLS